MNLFYKIFFFFGIPNLTFENKTSNNNSNETSLFTLESKTSYVSKINSVGSAIKMTFPLIERFELERILVNDRLSRRLLGKIENQNAILVIDNMPISDQTLKEIQLSAASSPTQLTSISSSATSQFIINNFSIPVISNPPYFTFSTNTTITQSNSKLQLIFPASENHIRKYSKQKFMYFDETATNYKEKTKPMIENLLTNINPNWNKWILDILNGIAEKESIIFKDDFLNVIHDNVRNDQTNKELIHLLIFPSISINRYSNSFVRTVRDLNSKDDLPWLLHVRDSFLKKTLCSLIPELKYNELKCYFHYLPTYFYLHIHVRHINSPIDSDLATQIGSSMLLEDVIENLTLVPNYFEKRTIRFAIGDQHPFYKQLTDENLK